MTNLGHISAGGSIKHSAAEGFVWSVEKFQRSVDIC